MKEDKFWEIADWVKRELFNCIRSETAQIDFTDFKAYRQKFEEIPSSLLKKWEEIKEKFKEDPNIDLARLKGYLYEVLFYYACLNRQAIFFDAELAEMGGANFFASPPWFGTIPLFDIIPFLHRIQEDGVWKRKAPQIKADFLVQYVDDDGPLPPALIDVKSSKHRKYNNGWNWQVTAAMRCGFIFQIAYPKKGVEYPRSLAEWEIKTPCRKCKRLSDNYRKCSLCEENIFSFTIADAYYEAKELWEKLGRIRKGRF